MTEIRVLEYLDPRGRSPFARWKDAEAVIVLLGGSGKSRQQEAIEAAQERWLEYRRRRRVDA